jgi:UDP-N-acetylglucosamine 2-epimerase (non-hydrolysing)
MNEQQHGEPILYDASAAHPLRCMLVYGTRPEVIKLAPLILAMRRRPASFHCTQVFTGQHRELGRQAMKAFRLIPDVDLNCMEEDQHVNEFFARALAGLDQAIGTCAPQWVIVQGDTSSALAGALAGFNRKIPVAHVEAGLRTDDLSAPHPEEGNRRMIGRIASLHLAPTARAADALRREHVPADRIAVTGNTAVDAVRRMRRGLRPMVDPLVRGIVGGATSRLVLATIHRRETFGRPLLAVLEAIKELASDPVLGLTFLFLVHPNPRVGEAVDTVLDEEKNIRLLPALDYRTTLALISLSWLILTDSGGLQEEAPCFSVPVLVLRNRTERPEGIEAGIAKLIGTDKNNIVAAVRALACDTAAYAKMRSAGNPYGDGHAVSLILDWLRKQSLSITQMHQTTSAGDTSDRF